MLKTVMRTTVKLVSPRTMILCAKEGLSKVPVNSGDKDSTELLSHRIREHFMTNSFLV